MADSTWANPEADSALTDVTPAGNGTAANPAAAAKNEEALKLAREAGWVKPTGYNYDAKAPVTLLGDGVASQPAVDPAADGEPGAEDPAMSRYQTSTWAHDAAKYEWKDDFGDVGPRDEKLEQELFHSETITRKGAKIEK